MALPAYNANALITKTRRAVWDAIDNWQPLRDWVANCIYPIFKHRMEDDLNEIISTGSSYFELPSITVLPGNVTEAWEVNRMAKFADSITIDIKTPYLDQAEELSEMIWQAVWQSAPADNPSVSYVRSVTGRLPKVISINRSIISLNDGQKSQRAWLFSMTLTLAETQDVLSTILQARAAS